MAAETTAGMLVLRVLTPEGSILEGDVFEVSLPGSEGELGVLPAHAALLTQIVPGPLAYRAPEGQGTIALGRGVAEVREDRVTVLVEQAVAAEDVDVAATEARRRQLLAEREAVGISEERLAEIDEEIVVLDVRLRVTSPAAGAAH